MRNFFEEMLQEMPTFVPKIVPEVKREVKREVNSLRSWELKRTLPSSVRTASKTIVQHSVLYFQPAKRALLPIKLHL